MTNGKLRTVLYFVAEDWYFWSHRLPLARAAMAEGYRVVLVTRVAKHADLIRKEGITLIPVNIQRRSTNPWRELKLLMHLVKIYRQQKPSIVHHVALKPILYGSIAAWLTSVPVVVNALAGLGYIFSSEQWRARVLRPLVKMAYRKLLNHRHTRTIIQNPDDLSLLMSLAVLSPENAALIRGSGVDVSMFRPSPEPAGVPVVVLVSRMLWDKGVQEYVKAARILLKKGIGARFVLVGDRDAENPTAIPLADLEAWRREGVVEWWGQRDDIQNVFAQSHVVCLPSYREGLPKVLLEAAACGRPIVASDVAGCREIVRHQISGLLVPPRQIEPLAEALELLINSRELRRKYGVEGRKLAEQEFGVTDVARKTLKLYGEMLA